VSRPLPREAVETGQLAYGRAGIARFIFMIFAPYFLDEIQGLAEGVIPAAR
jgi:hypothetical protein